MLRTDQAAITWRLAEELACARQEGQVGAALARASAGLTGAESARVWMIDRRRGYRLSGGWPGADSELDAAPQEVAQAVVFGTTSVTAARSPFRSRLTVPLLTGLRPLGAIELLEGKRTEGPFTNTDAGNLTGLVEAAGSALEAVRASAAHESGNIEAITRLTQLFDISRSLFSTLDVEKLQRMIVNRVEASLEPEVAYLWFADDSGSRLSIAAASESMAKVVKGWKLEKDKGVTGRVAASSEPLLIDDPTEVPGLDERPDAAAGLVIRSLAASPMISSEGRLLGVLEVVNKADGGILERGDLLFLSEVAGTAALAIENARRLHAERRASDLGSLLNVAQDLGSHLDVQKAAFTLVHRAASVISYRRASVGLFRGTRMEVTAVSGHTFVDESVPEMKALRETLTWAAGLEEGVYVVQQEDGTIDAVRAETREKFGAYFAATGLKTFLAVPLRDDEGRLGVFALEAAEPYAFSTRDIEAAGLLGVQATIAVRNATLYQQIPMMRVFRPLGRQKARFLSLSYGRRLAWLAGMALGAVLLVLAPVPLRVSGEARVLPQLRIPVTTEVEGRVARVQVREGDRVEVGQVLAAIDESDYHTREDQAMARYEVALRESNRLRAEGRTGGAAIESARLEGLRAEVDLWQRKIARTQIRSTVDGIVATPRIEEVVGAHLARGSLFCEVVEPGRLRLELVIPEHDVGLVAPGMPVKFKLHAFPARSFMARVERVGVVATLDAGEPVFLVRAGFEETIPSLRAGMTGRAKINTGSSNILMIGLRRPAAWIWGLVWGSLP